MILISCKLFNIFGSMIILFQIEINKGFFINKPDHYHNFVHYFNEKRAKRQINHENNDFINELSNIALKSLKSQSDFGHKLIEVNKIGNVSRVRLLFSL